MERKKFQERNEVYSHRLKAGKRTYFFDVKATRHGDYFITVTESKKVAREDGEGFFYEKHKIFLQKEDFMSFMEGLQQSIDHVKTLMPDFDFTRDSAANRYDDDAEGRGRYNQQHSSAAPEDSDTELRW